MGVGMPRREGVVVVEKDLRKDVGKGVAHTGEGEVEDE